MYKKAKWLFTCFMTIAVGLAAFAGCGSLGDSAAGENNIDPSVEIIYAKAQEYGYRGTLEEFLNICKGAKGDPGEKGEDGADGTDGKDGTGIKDVYMIDGYLYVSFDDGRADQKIAEIKGEKGDQGVGVDRVEIDADGNLVIYYTDAPKEGVVVGKVVGEDGKDGLDISTIEVNANNQIVIMLNNGMKLICESVSDIGMNSSYSKITMSSDRIVKATRTDGEE